MGDADGLDRWIDNTPQRKAGFEKSLFPHEQVVLDSLKERILELERMKEQIRCELDRLKKMAENH